MKQQDGPPVFLDTLDDPRLHPYRHLKQTNLTRWSGRFIAEGWRVVERLLRSGLPIESILMSRPKWGQHGTKIPPGVPCLVLPLSLARELVGYNFHAGVLACGIRPQPVDLEILIRRPPPTIVVVCPHTTDPDNMGQIVRLGAAFGAAGLLIGNGCADPFSRRALRVAMGNTLQHPIRQSADLRADLVRLRQSGFELIATTLDRRAEPLAQTAASDRVAILFGNEAHGLDAGWLELADRHVTIPMAAGVDSLNVAASVAIVLYHFAQHE